VTVLATILLLVLPFFGGAGPSPLTASAYAESSTGALMAVTQQVVTEPAAEAAVAEFKTGAQVGIAAAAPVPTTDSEHLAQKPVPPPPPVITKSSRASGTEARRAAAAAAGQSCPGNVGGSTGSAPAAVSALGVQGTTSADLASFATNFNAIRVANCLKPIPLANFRYDACMESRLAWMAEDPHPNPANTWGHVGTHSVEADANGVFYSDAVPSRGCDGNLAGGARVDGANLAQRWWDSIAHRNSLYRPSNNGSTAGVCIYFAMTHGDGNNGAESTHYNRGAARSGGC
jgi:hypothetical protein